MEPAFYLMIFVMNEKNQIEKIIFYGMIFDAKKIMKKILFCLNLLLSISIFAQSSKDISGLVTYNNTPLKDVNIVVENTSIGTITNSKGYYSIKAKKNDVLLFTYLGMRPIKIVIEDVTRTLNIEMIVSENTLKEVTIIGKKRLDFGTKSNKFSTSRGTMNSRKAGFGITYIDGEDLNHAAINLGQSLVGRVSGYRLLTDKYGFQFAYLRSSGSIKQSTNAIWDVDGVIYKSVPPLILDNIKDIRVIRSLAGTVRYGAAGSGGVIVVTTKVTDYENTEDIYSKSNPYTNKEYYNNDALPIEKIKTGKPLHLKLFDTISDSRIAYEKYIEIKSSFEDRPNFHFDIANYFLKIHNDLKNYQNILLDLENYATKNAEVLKALAYNYQKNELHQKALTIYKKIARLRPNYAQSFRDLANAYLHLEDYQNAWKIYRYYLHKGNTIEGNAIGEIMYREMETLYMLKGKVANIKDGFIRKENSSDNISADIRMVFEWNTSEAEFALEFVNPQMQSYIIEHSIAESAELILDEKLKGYTSKEFIIDKIGVGNWLVNINYLGNKKYTPTYLKTTVYYNWGRPNQTERIDIFKLTVKNLKIKLLKLNKIDIDFFK